jgi:CRP-like cAMP-binding protein
MASSPSPIILPPNRLLSLLTNDVRQQMLPMLHQVTLKTGEFLAQANQPVSTVYFPLSFVASSIKTMKDGVTIEVATVGNEGFIGMPLLLGSESETIDTIVQVDGEALSMSAKDFSQTLGDGSSGLRSILLRYAQAAFSQVIQNAACNQSHTIERRCARWILMTQDRVGEPSFMLGHHYLSFMLAAPKERVTSALETLPKNGLVHDGHRLQVLDRERLEQASCDCYRIIKHEYDRLLSAS